MNKIQKPEWLLFAGKVRVQLDNVKPSKSGKREERLILSTWKEAILICYEGSHADWEYLLHRLGRQISPRSNA